MTRANLSCLTVLVTMTAAVADVPTRSAVSDRRLSVAKQQPSQAEQDFLRGAQLAHGEGVEQDYAQAAKFYQSAAEKGHVAAQYNLAYLYEHGLGVAHDFKQAATWYRKAALQGDAEAQNNLGVLYATGRGVPHRDADAVHWYRLAAAQSDPEGMSNLGMMYLQGRGLKRDLIEAFKWIRQSAENGYAVAQNNLALMYANGQAVARDCVWAYTWFDIAAGKLTASAQLRDQIAKEMKPEEIQRARTRAEIKRTQIFQKANGTK